MALQSWATLNAQNEKNVIPSSQPSQQNGILDGATEKANFQATISKASNFFSNLNSHFQQFNQNVGRTLVNNAKTAVTKLEQPLQQLSPGQGKLPAGMTEEQAVAKLNSTIGNNIIGGSFAGDINPIGKGLTAPIYENPGQTSSNTTSPTPQPIPTAPTEAPQVSEQPQPTANIQKTGIADVTPNYKPNMIGQNVMTPDTTDAEGNIVKGKITPRVAEENTNFTGQRPVTTSAFEHAAGTEVNNIPDYPHGNTGTNLQKGLAVDKAISTEAEGMRGNLQAEDKANPLNAETEKAKVIDLVKSNIPKDIQEKIGYIGKDSPLSKVGIRDNPQTPLNRALQEAMSPAEDNLPKTAAGRYYQKVLDALNEYDGTREGKLNLRQSIDEAYKNARGKLAFGSDSQNALDETNTDIRDAINKDLKATTENIDTQASLDKQSRLYKAKDNLYEKARSEAGNKSGRFEQKHPAAKFVKRQLARKGVGTVLTVGATAAGVPLITAAAKKILGGATKKGKALK